MIRVFFKGSLLAECDVDEAVEYMITAGPASLNDEVIDLFVWDKDGRLLVEKHDKGGLDVGDCGQDIYEVLTNGGRWRETFASGEVSEAKAIQEHK